MATKSKLKKAQEELNDAISITNKGIAELGTHTVGIYTALTRIQDLFDRIRHVPSDKKLEYKKLVEVRCTWKEQVERIESDYNDALKKNSTIGAEGIGVGIGIAALGPTAAMGIATTFGVASTGTAISALSGAAATNAALAWLGGGALAAGGGGMAAGEAFLAMAGPIGWTIAGIAFFGSMLLIRKAKKENSQLEGLFTLITYRDTKKYHLATVEINERIRRIIYETKLLNNACEKIETFGTNFREMTEAQQYELGAYLNLMKSSTKLLVNPILGLQPNYTKTDLERFISNDSIFSKDGAEDNNGASDCIIKKYPDVLVGLANLLYKIDFNHDDADILCKSLRKNEDFLKGLNISKNEFSVNLLYRVRDLLDYHYENKWSLCGKIDGESWENDTFLLETLPGIWESNPIVIDGEFKLRYGRKWKDNRGGKCTSEGVAFHVYNDGENIVPPVAGHVYVVRYDTVKEEVTLRDVSAERDRHNRNSDSTVAAHLSQEIKDGLSSIVSSLSEHVISK